MPIPGPDNDIRQLAVPSDVAGVGLVVVGFASAELMAAGVALPELEGVEVLEASRHPALVYLASLAPGSRPTMRKALDVVARLLTGGSFEKGHLVGGLADHASMPWHRISYAHAQAVRTELAGHYAHTTACKILSALRMVATEAWRLELMDGDTRARIVDIAGVKGTSIPAGRSLAAGELRALFAICAEDPTPAGRRDAAMLALLYGCGMRRSEAQFSGPCHQGQWRSESL